MTQKTVLYISSIDRVIHTYDFLYNPAEDVTMEFNGDMYKVASSFMDKISANGDIIRYIKFGKIMK